MKLQKMRIMSKDLKVGDIVLTDDKKQIYFIIDSDKTFLHNHTRLKCFYPDTQDTEIWMLEEISTYKTIWRAVI